MEYREAATASLITDFEPRKSIVAEVVADSNDEDNILRHKITVIKKLPS